MWGDATNNEIEVFFHIRNSPTKNCHTKKLLRWKFTQSHKQLSNPPTLVCSIANLFDTTIRTFHAKNLFFSISYKERVVAIFQSVNVTFLTSEAKA